MPMELQWPFSAKGKQQKKERDYLTAIKQKQKREKKGKRERKHFKKGEKKNLAIRIYFQQAVKHLH